MFDSIASRPVRRARADTDQKSRPIDRAQVARHTIMILLMNARYARIR